MKWFGVFNRIALSVVVASMLALLACVPAHMRTMDLPGGCNSWSDLPMTVAVDEKAEPYVGAFSYGIEAWNQALGGVFLKTFSGADPADADVLVVVGDFDKRLGASTELTCRNGHLVATILVRPTMDGSRVKSYALHELGHAMGLGHNPNEQSVMNQNTPPGLMDGEAGPDVEFVPSQRILPVDVRLVIALHPTKR